MFHFLKLLKIVATRGEILSLKFTKYRLTAGLGPNPLGGTPSRNKGPTSKRIRARREEGKRGSVGKGGKKERKGRGGRRGGDGKEREEAGWLSTS